MTNQSENVSNLKQRDKPKESIPINLLLIPTTSNSKKSKRKKPKEAKLMHDVHHRKKKVKTKNVHSYLEETNNQDNVESQNQEIAKQSQETVLKTEMASQSESKGKGIAKRRRQHKESNVLEQQQHTAMMPDEASTLEACDKKISESLTFDEKYLANLSKFEVTERLLPMRKEEHQKIATAINQLLQSKNTKKKNYFHEITKLEQRKIELEKEIHLIESKELQNDYLLEIAPLLFDYVKETSKVTELFEVGTKKQVTVSINFKSKASLLHERKESSCVRKIHKPLINMGATPSDGLFGETDNDNDLDVVITDMPLNSCFRDPIARSPFEFNVYTIPCEVSSKELEKILNEIAHSSKKINYTFYLLSPLYNHGPGDLTAEEDYFKIKNNLNETLSKVLSKTRMSFKDLNVLTIIFEEGLNFLDQPSGGNCTSMSANDNIDSFVTVVPPINHVQERSIENILERYQENIEGKMKRSSLDDGCDYCLKCNTLKIVLSSDATFVCPQCGESESFIDTSVKNLSYGQTIEVTSASYNRANHFREWLNQFQGKERTKVPNKVYLLLIEEFKKHHKNQVKYVTPKRVREYLRKLKISDWYEHIPHIVQRLTGIPPPCMSKDQEDRLIRMFLQIQEPFFRIPKDKRKRVNFLSYSYVLYKFCELTDQDEFLKCFSLLKSDENILKHDEIWKMICQELEWQYYETFTSS